VDANGNDVFGYSAEALPPGWFDKRIGRTYEQQIRDQIDVIGYACNAFASALHSPGAFFPAWIHIQQLMHAYVIENDLPQLLGSFGASMAERAILDAIARAENVSFADAVRRNLYGIDAGSVHRELAGVAPRDWLPEKPAKRISVRHTVGLIDPLTAADISPSERLDDGLPQSLEDYVRSGSLRFFKIKVSNRLDFDIERLKAIATIIERYRGGDYAVTIDGNEQYTTIDDLEGFYEAVLDTPSLETFWQNTLIVEQPLDRAVALDEAHAAGLHKLSSIKPLIIDESDDSLDSYARAIGMGYRGTSSKSCKGPLKSLLNAGLTWHRNNHGQMNTYQMTGEDLSCVGMVALQSDLCLVSTVGLTHVERNGHHYYRGLSHLPRAEQERILDAHPDLYHMNGDRVCVRLDEGVLDIASLQCPGFGFAIEPDISIMTPAEEWKFDSLGLGKELDNEP
jgi:hypothetical protein